ncbi:MAG: DegT/DnrJ/EryC1/StrS family aminotransferase, partial [Flavobacteriaceae bacterium]
DELKTFLYKNGIQTAIHYPIAPHQQEALKEYNTLKLPITEQLHQEVLSLPMSPVQTIEETQTLVHYINSF